MDKLKYLFNIYYDDVFNYDDDNDGDVCDVIHDDIYYYNYIDYYNDIDYDDSDNEDEDEDEDDEDDEEDKEDKDDKYADDDDFDIVFSMMMMTIMIMMI